MRVGSRLIAAGVLLLAGQARAGWWFFGKATGRPELLRVYAGGIELGEERARLFREHLLDGRLQVKGFFRQAPGAPVAQARVSLDGGASWRDDATLDRDSFLLAIEPEAGRAYKLQVRLSDTKGQENDPADLGPAEFVFEDRRAEELATEALLQLAQRYAARDLRGFSSLVSDDFRGDRGSLEDAVASDFRTFAQLSAEITPEWTEVKGADARVQFRYRMSGVRAADGATTKAEGTAAYTLRLEGGRFRLLEMPPPAVFGSTVGAGEKPVAGGGSVEDDDRRLAGGGALLPGVLSGQATLTEGVGFRFSTQSQAAAAPGAVDVSATFGGLGPYLLGWSASSTGGTIGPISRDLDEVSVVSNPGSVEYSAVAGWTYVVFTDQGRYAALQATSVGGGAISFRWIYQPDGSPRFR